MRLPNQLWIQDNTGQQLPDAITSLTSTPDTITLSGNRSNFTFSPRTTGLIPDTAGATIRIQAHVPIGATITLISDVASVTLTASATPSANEFYTTVSTVINAQYLKDVAESIADQLDQNTAFANKYSISLINATVFINAKQFGDLYTFTTASTSEVVSIIDITSTVGTSLYLSQDPIDYKPFTELYFSREIYEQPVNKLSATKFPLDMFVDANTSDGYLSTQDLISNTLSVILPIKDLITSNNYYKMDQGFKSDGTSVPNTTPQGDVMRHLRPYFMIYGDSFRWTSNGSRVRKVKGQTPVRWMQIGAVGSIDLYDMQDYVWNPNNTKVFKWLTSCPQNKVVTRDSHEFLQVICKLPQNNYTYNMEITYTFSDGSTTVVNKPSLSYSGMGGNVSFDVSPTVIGLQGQETLSGLDVIKYSIRLNWEVNGSISSFSESKTYMMDENCYDSTENIIFINEYGGWDSIELKGANIETLVREITVLSRGELYNANKLEGFSNENTIISSNNASTLTTLDTGLLGIPHLRWLKTLGKSTAVFLWDKKVNKYKNIIIEDFDYEVDSKTTSGSIPISYSIPNSDKTINR